MLSIRAAPIRKKKSSSSTLSVSTDNKSRGDNDQNKLDPEEVIIKEAFKKYISFSREDLSESNTLKWSEAELEKSSFKGWKIRCHTRRYETTFLVRTEVLFDNVELAEVAEAHNLYHARKQLEEYQIVEQKKDDHIIHYLKFKSIFSGRLDLLMKVSFRPTSSGAFLFCRDVKHPQFPVVPELQRIEIWCGIYLKQEGKRVRQVSFQYLDSVSNLLLGFDQTRLIAHHQLLAEAINDLKSRKEKERIDEAFLTLNPIQKAFLQFELFSAENLKDKTLKWRPTYLEEIQRIGLRITAHTRDMQNGRILIKTSAVFTFADLNDIAQATIVYYQNLPGYQYELLENKNKNSFVQYFRWKAGVPFMSDREVVSHGMIHSLDEAVFVWHSSNERSEKPTSENVVRADLWYSALLKKIGKNVVYESFRHMDKKTFNRFNAEDHLEHYETIVTTMRQIEINRKSSEKMQNLTVNTNNATYAKYLLFASEDLNNKWTSTKLTNVQKPGFCITCHTRKHQNTDLIRSSITFENTSIENVAETLPDLMIKDPALKECRLIEKKEDGTLIYYLRFDIPIPFVADRDMVWLSKWEKMPDGTIFCCSQSTEHADAPLVPKVERCLYWSGIVLKQNGSNVSYESYEFLDCGHAALNGFDPSSVLSDNEKLAGILAKKGNSSTGNGSAIEGAYSQYQSYASEDLNDARLKWRPTDLRIKRFQRFELTCYTRPYKNSNLVHTSVLFFNTQAVNVVNAFESVLKTGSMLENFQQLEKKSDGSKILYMKYCLTSTKSLKNIFFELILEMNKKEMQDGSTFVSLRSVEHARMPITKNIPRIEYWAGILLAQKGRNVSFESFDYQDKKSTRLNTFSEKSVISDITLMSQLCNPSD